MTTSVRLSHQGGKGKIVVTERRRNDPKSESAPLDTLNEKGDETVVHLHEGNEMILREE